MALAPSLAVFRHRAYLHYWAMRQMLTLSREMAAVAIGWQVYVIARETRSIEESALFLGLVGLAQFLPVLFLSLVGGQAADRFDRRKILILANLVRVAALIWLFFMGSASTGAALPAIFIAATFFGAVNAFTPGASNSLYPTLVPREQLPNAIAWNSLGFQASTIIGPAIGGLILIVGVRETFAAAAGMTLLAVLAIATAKTPVQPKLPGARAFRMALDGLRFVRDNRIVFGAISLDLVVVLFGGVTALLPIFARDILHVGAEGLGYLRAAPAAGAAIIAFMLAVRPLSRRVGPYMLIAIAVYGLAMLVFAFSPLFWLSMLALAVSGAADMISVYVRQSLIQFATPDGMRGRVSSVSFIFISASNELGEFESGLAARFLGPVGAVVLGGVVALAAALAWTRLFPQLSKADTFEGAAPENLASEPARIAPRLPENGDESRAPR